MKATECMTREVRIVDPAETLQDASRIMAEFDTGFLPVGEDDRLIGIVTDRDIAIRAVANGRGPATRIREVMTEEILYCFADDDCEEALANMAELQVRRLPVIDHDKRLVGIVSISDLAVNGEGPEIAETIADIARPSGLHSQSI